MADEREDLNLGLQLLAMHGLQLPVTPPQPAPKTDDAAAQAALEEHIQDRPPSHEEQAAALALKAKLLSMQVNLAALAEGARERADVERDEAMGVRQARIQYRTEAFGRAKKRELKKLRKGR